MNVKQALALQGLLRSSDSAEIDALWLLEWATGWSSHQLRFDAQRELTSLAESNYLDALLKRQQGHPVAYLRGDQGFWSLELKVAPHTLIPRPDTECLVEVALSLGLTAQTRALDLGTGTGAIALSIAVERPSWSIEAVDRVIEAVQLAELNKTDHGLDNVRVYQSAWFSQVKGEFDLIVSNPPYIREADPHLQCGDVRYEPMSALASGPDGLDDIRVIVDQAPNYLSHQGWLLLEHGYDQADAVRQLLLARGFVQVSTKQDFGANDRVTSGQWCI